MLSSRSVARRAELVEHLLDEGSALLDRLPSPERKKLGMELLGSAELQVPRSPLASLLLEEWKCLAADEGMSGMPSYFVGY
jgi:hypothetical protein